MKDRRTIVTIQCKASGSGNLLHSDQCGVQATYGNNKPNRLALWSLKFEAVELGVPLVAVKAFGIEAANQQ